MTGRVVGILTSPDEGFDAMLLTQGDTGRPVADPTNDPGTGSELADYPMEMMWLLHCRMSAGRLG